MLLINEIENKAQALAAKVAASSGYAWGNGIEPKTREIILKASRRSIVDGFPLDEYLLDEIPYSDRNGSIAFFVNIAESGVGTGENYNPNAHEIIFWCEHNSYIAVPCALCNDGSGDFHEQRDNCFNAVYQRESPQRSQSPDRIENFLRMMVIADLHAWDKQELKLIKDYDFHCCVLLGDIPLEALKIIRSIVVDESLFGILGNHDEPGALERCGITDLTGKAVTVQGVTIAGLSGSHRYKHGDYSMLTQRESVLVAKKLPAADILISHDTAYHVMGRKDSAHCGLQGISGYISHRKPKLNLCGHYHQNLSRSFRGCKIRCIYRCALVDFFMRNKSSDFEVRQMVF